MTVIFFYRKRTNQTNKIAKQKQKYTDNSSISTKLSRSRGIVELLRVCKYLGHVRYHGGYHEHN